MWSKFIYYRWDRLRKTTKALIRNVNTEPVVNKTGVLAAVFGKMS
jgi:hypothetical protein